MLTPSRTAPRGVGLSRRHHLRCPRLEALEPRHLLAVGMIVVDTFDDVVNVVDGLTSLREAILEANASVDDYQIQLPAGTYRLTIQGADENAAATGDLDILASGSLNIVGEGAESTTIDAAGLGFGDEFEGGDRVFDIHGARFELAGVTLIAGRAATGGAIQSTGGQGTITECDFSDNSADEGGAIYNTGQMSIVGGTLANNSAGAGGAIHNTGQIRIVGATLSANLAANSNGGGIYNAGNMTLTGSTLGGNSASSGGGIHNLGDATIVDTTLSNNSATVFSGGGISNQGEATIIASTLSGNQAAFHGGGIANGGEATIIDSNVSGNSVINFGGGGVHNERHANLTITGSILSNNIASNGAGSALQTYGTLTIIDSTISHNSGSRHAIESVGDTTITGTTISENIGGGILHRARTLVITSSTLSGNSIFNFGGAIYNSSLATISASTISNNWASISGGAIFNDFALTLTDTTLSGNTAVRDGGGIYNAGQLLIRHATLTGNRANANGASFRHGGGLYLRSGLATLDHVIVAGNVVGPAPGATPSDIELNVGQVESVSSYNLIGDPATAGGVIHGTHGNIVGDGSGNPLDVNTVLHTTLSDNGGPTLTHALVAGSPAINAGNPNFAPPPDYDQRAAPFVRVYGGRIDIGAFEVQVATIAAAIQQFVENGTLSSGQANSLTAALTFNSNQQATLNRIHAFINHVRGFVRGGVLTQAEGRSLIEAAESLRDSLSPLDPAPAAADAAFAQLADELADEATLLDTLEYEAPGPGRLLEEGKASRRAGIATT